MNTKTDTIRRIAAQTIAGAATVTRRTAMLIALLTMTTTVSAQVVTTVSTWSDLQTSVQSSGEIQLTADLTASEQLWINEKNVTLDLNGHKLNMNGKRLYIIGNLIVKDTSTGGAGSITTSSNNLLYVGYTQSSVPYPGTMTLESGKISGYNYSIRVSAGSSLTINGGEVSGTMITIYNNNKGSFEMNGGKVSSSGSNAVYNSGSFVMNGGRVVTSATSGYAVCCSAGSSAEINGGTIEAPNGSDISGCIGIYAHENTEVTIHDGTITAYNAALLGKDGDENSNAKFTIEGGTLTSTNNEAIYAPQALGEVNITGGTITGATVGVFLRGGTLNIQGGTITGNTGESSGSAVYVAQNENKLDINVNISGGTLIGYLPLSEHNTNQDATEEDLRKINYAITGGLFHSTGTETIRIEDYLNGPFISSGRFTHSVDQYVANGYFQFQDSNTDPYYVCLPYLADGMNYLQTSDTDVDVATYTKSLGANRVNKRQGWMVPFDHTITQDDEALFTFYKINMIANSPSPDAATSNDIWVFLTKLNEGDVLHANMPYVYKPKQEVTDYPFTSNNVTLKAKNTGVIAKAETLEDVYSFYGTYENTTPTASDPFYYVNIDGNLSLGNNGSVTVGPYRWILRKTSKYGSTPSYVREIHFFDGEEDATSISEELRVKSEESAEWFTLDGRKLAGKPTKSGMYVVGGKKVVIK